MGLLLPSVFDDLHARHPLLVFQSSTAQSSLPLLHHFLSKSVRPPKNGPPCHNLVFCLLYSPTTLLKDTTAEHLTVYDWLGRVPGYTDTPYNVPSDMLSAIKEVPLSTPLIVTIDSVETLSSDIGSDTQTYTLLHDIYSLLQSRPVPSRLVLHVVRPFPLTHAFTSTAFSPALALVTVHPTALLTHIATEYLTFPPPASPVPKFWGVFIPVSERISDTESVVFGRGGEGSGSISEAAVEVLVRSIGGKGRDRGVERVLEGWSLNTGSCELMALNSLKGLRVNHTAPLNAPDPTQNISFNLNLTPAQHESRSRVPLPYVHEGQAKDGQKGAIFYEPDSADDIDDDDPDEDLDI